MVFHIFLDWLHTQLFSLTTLSTLVLVDAPDDYDSSETFSVNGPVLIGMVLSHQNQ